MLSPSSATNPSAHSIDRVTRGLAIALACLAFALPVSIAGSSLLYFPLLALFVLGCFWFSPEWRPRWAVVEIAFTAFWGVSLISALGGIDPWHSRVRLEKDLYFLMVVMVGGYLKSRSIDGRSLLKTMLAGGLLTASFGILQMILRVNRLDHNSGNYLNVPSWLAGAHAGLIKYLSLTNGRATGLRSHPLTFSETLLFPIAYLLARLADRRQFSWATWASATAILVLALLGSQSRGAWIAFGVMGFVLMIVERRVSVWSRVLTIFVLPVLLLLWVPTFRSRLHSIGDKGFRSNLERRIMWSAGFRMFKEHPLLGIGPGSTPIASTHYQTPDQAQEFGPWGHLHSTYITVLAERGLLGMLAFLAFIGIVAGTLLRSLDPLRADNADEHQIVLTAILGLAGWLVAGLTEAVFHDSSIAMLFYFVIGVALTYAKR